MDNKDKRDLFVEDEETLTAALIPKNRRIVLANSTPFLELHRAKTLHGFCLLVVAFAAGAIGFVLARFPHHRSTGLHIAHDTTWAEAAPPSTLQAQRFDGTLLSRNAYMGPPSPEIDAAWNRFTTNPWMVETAVVLNVSRQEMLASGNGRSAGTIVELDEANGGGFMGTIEMFHQLHCLNMLRKWTYMDYYIDKDRFFTTRLRREHADHCIDILRQALMCKGDTGLIMFHWVDGVAVPSPDFSTLHECRNPEAILAWARSRAAPIKHAIERRPGDLQADGLF